MNSKSIVIMLVASVTFSQLFKQSNNEKSHSLHLGSRGPAAESQPTVKKVQKRKVITQKEMNELKDKLASLEADLKKKEEIIDAKNKEVELVKNAKDEERIQKLNQLLEDQKKQIAILADQIKNTAVRDVTIVKEETVNVRNEFNVVLCLAKAQQSKLEDEIKKLLKDKEDVISEVAALRSQNEELKKKPVEVKVEEKKEDKKEEKDESISKEKRVAKKHSQNFDINSEDGIGMLSQITSMLMSEQQVQMQMQMQMFSMMNSIQSMSQNNMFMGQNPYSHYNQNDQYGYQSDFGWGDYSHYPSMHSSFGFLGSNNGVGIGHGGYQPYSIYAGGIYGSYPAQASQATERQPSAVAPASTQAVAPEVSMTPQVRSYDFNLNGLTPLQQPELLQMERVNL